MFNKDQPLLTHINSTHAGLNLQGWTSGGCPITDLMLDFRPKGTWAWQSLKANSTNQLFLSELREATWYELKMKACNSAGCGNQTSQFATTDYDGSECSPCFPLLLPLAELQIIFVAVSSNSPQVQSLQLNRLVERGMMWKNCFPLALLSSLLLWAWLCSSSSVRNARRRGLSGSEVRARRAKSVE